MSALLCPSCHNEPSAREGCRECNQIGRVMVCDYIDDPCPGGERTELGNGDPREYDLTCPQCHGKGYYAMPEQEAREFLAACRRGIAMAKQTDMLMDALFGSGAHR